MGLGRRADGMLGGGGSVWIVEQRDGISKSSEAETPGDKDGTSMSGKRDKAVRRQVDKHSVALFAKAFNAICDKPFGERFRFAWRIVTGRGVQR